MRLLKTLLIAALVVFALTAGIVVTAVVAAIGLVIFFVRRVLLPSTPKRPAPPIAHAAGAPAHRGGGDVIDVTATEVR